MGGSAVEEIVFFCTSCGTKLSAGEDEIGAEFECPKCNTVQTVPDEDNAPADKAVAEPEPSRKEPSNGKVPSLVIRIPKKKIVLSSGAHSSEDETMAVGEEYEEEIGGNGLRIFAVMLGTIGVVLCGLSLVWAVFLMNHMELNWWFRIMIFISTFLMGVMGLVLAGFIFLVVRIAGRIELLTSD